MKLALGIGLGIVFTLFVEFLITLLYGWWCSLPMRTRGKWWKR